MCSGFLVLLVFLVLGEDVLVRGALVRNLRVVVPTETVRSSLERMVPDPPATLRLAVDLAYAGVDADDDSADECCLTEVGSEA